MRGINNSANSKYECFTCDYQSSGAAVVWNEICVVHSSQCGLCCTRRPVSALKTCWGFTGWTLHRWPEISSHRSALLWFSRSSAEAVLRSVPHPSPRIHSALPRVSHLFIRCKCIDMMYNNLYYYIIIIWTELLHWKKKMYILNIRFG